MGGPGTHAGRGMPVFATAPGPPRDGTSQVRTRCTSPLGLPQDQRRKTTMEAGQRLPPSTARHRRATGAKLRAAREAAGHSLAGMAALTYFSKPYLEPGRNRPPRRHRRVVERYEQVLGVPSAPRRPGPRSPTNGSSGTHPPLFICTPAVASAPAWSSRWKPACRTTPPRRHHGSRTCSR